MQNNLIEYVTLVEPFDASRSNRSRPSTARLSILLGPEEGRTYKIFDECVVGRGSDATFRLPDRGVSRAHARIRRLPGGTFSIEDLGSRNGTLVNGTRILGGPLEPGDRVQIGPRCLLLFSVQDDLEESLAQAKNLEIIGRLSAGINHDFNNLLCVVLANAAHLLELPRELTLTNTEVRESLQDIRSAAETGAELTARLATLIQGGFAPFQTLDFSDLCEKTLAVLRDTFAKNVRIQAHIQPGILVRGVAAHLRHLIINPCLNARDAMPDGGILSLEVVLKTPSELPMAPLVKADRYVVLSVRDTGTGMDADVLASAFEAFFTTRAIDVGSGLGLSIVRKVAADMGGTADLQSRKGHGTTFRAVLPVIELLPDSEHEGDSDRAGRRDLATLDASYAELSLDRAMLEGAPAFQPASDPPIASLGHRVLIVQDDEALGRAFSRALRRAGYDVVWVSNSEEALGIVSRVGDGFDLAIVDLDLPDAAGRQTHAALRARNEGLPIVVLRGAFEPDGRAVQFGPQDTLLRKSVDAAFLTRIVAEALSSRGSR